MDRPFALLFESARGLARGFIAQLPYIAVAVVVFVAFLLLAPLLTRFVRHALRRFGPALAEVVARLVHVALGVWGLLIAFWIAIPGVDFSQIFASLGVTGLILGFALKDMIENFVAGIIILWRHPFQIEDQISTEGYEGTVEAVNFRQTVLRTYDGVKVYIPNGQVFTAPFENLTANRTCRSLVEVGIAPTASVARARQVILQTLREIDGVLPEPEPAVLFAAIEDAANILHVLYWTAPPTRLSELTTKSIVTERLYDALPAAGIGFPDQTKVVRMLPPSGLPAVQGSDGSKQRSG
jgi:small-conductance mechanosensitive channel